MAREKKVKVPKIKKPKTPGRGKTVLSVIALVLALLTLGAGVYFGYTQWRAEIARNEAVDAKIAALEAVNAAEKNKESVFVQMEPHALAAAMADSAYLYQTQFSSLRYETGPEASALVKLRVPVTVTIFNTGEQTITVKGAALYPWETVFEEGFRQETVAAQQEAGFFGELAQGQRDSFSVPPGESVSIEIDARLRGIYTHPALEAETQRFFMDYYADPEHTRPDLAEDVKIEGKGVMNGRVNTLFRQALAFYCTQRNTRFTLTYAIQTARGNSFSATCVVPF